MDMYKDRIIKAIMNRGMKKSDAIAQYNNLSQSEEDELLEEWWEMKEKEKYKEMQIKKGTTEMQFPFLFNFL